MRAERSSSDALSVSELCTLRRGAILTCVNALTRSESDPEPELELGVEGAGEGEGDEVKELELPSELEEAAEGGLCTGT